MFDKLDIFQLAGGLAKHASTRQEIIARNIANADTPNYRAKDTAPFSATYRGGDLGPTLKTTRTRHIVSTDTASGPVDLRDAAGPSSPNGNTVSIETEMMKATEVRHQHELALSVYKSSMNILRTSVGRR